MASQSTGTHLPPSPPPKPTAVDCGMRQRRSGSATPPPLDGRCAGGSPVPRLIYVPGPVPGVPVHGIDEGARWSVSGMCGRIWTLRPSTSDRRRGRLPGLGPARHGQGAFGSLDRAGRPRAKRPGERGEDQAGQWPGEPSPRALWSVVGHFDRLIGGEALRVAARRAARA